MQYGVLNNEYSHNLANWINNMKVLEYQERINLLLGEQQMQLVKTYSLVPFKDGNCVKLN